MSGWKIHHWDYHSLKLTWHLKIGHPKRKLVFQPSIFRCYVSFRECKQLTPPLLAGSTFKRGSSHPPGRPSLKPPAEPPATPWWSPNARWDLDPKNLPTITTAGFKKAGNWAEQTKTMADYPWLYMCYSWHNHVLYCRNDTKGIEGLRGEKLPSY